MLHSTVSFIFLISVLLNLLLLLAFLLLCSVPTPSSCSSLCLIATLFTSTFTALINISSPFKTHCSHFIIYAGGRSGLLAVATFTETHRETDSD